MLMKPQVLRMLEYQDSVSHHDTDQADNTPVSYTHLTLPTKQGV